MPSFDEIVRRVTADPAFADRVRTDPRRALAGLDVSDDQLRHLDHLVRPIPPLDGQAGVPTSAPGSPGSPGSDDRSRAATS